MPDQLLHTFCPIVVTSHAVYRQMIVVSTTDGTLVDMHPFITETPSTTAFNGLCIIGTVAPNFPMPATIRSNQVNDLLPNIMKLIKQEKKVNFIDFC